MTYCKKCDHDHQGKRLAFICIGCPCPETPGREDVAAKEVIADPRNRFLVSVAGNQILVPIPIRWPLTKSEAMNLAAWIVVLADDDDAFSDVLEAVQNS